MKSYKAIIALSIIGALFLMVFMPRSSQKRTNQLVVGMMSGWAPFMIINGDSEYEGFDVDVAREIGQRMGKEVVIQDLGSLASCFVALEQGKVDMIMSGLDITQKRRDMLNMIYYTGGTVREFTLLFWQTIPHSIQSIENVKELSDAVVCAESGSAQEKFLDSYDFITKKRMNSAVDMVLDLRFGKSLAAIVEPRVAARLKKQNPELQLLSVALPTEFQVFGCGIAISKGNTKLAKEVSTIVQSMIKDGTMKKCEQKWQLEE